MNHLMRTEHHDTGEYVAYCGDTRVTAEPTPDAPVCTNCILAALNSSNERRDREIHELATIIRDGAGADFRKVLGWVDGITLRLERLERKAEKKGGKS